MTRVLVAYSSKHGSTAEIAKAVADTLTANGLAAECRDASHLESLDGYDAVVLGSAVYMGRWRREARRFLRQHAKALAERPLWVFSSGPVGDPAKDNAAWLEPHHVIERAQELGLNGHVVFGGAVSTGSMAKHTRPEYRDRRDWDEIRAWAENITAELAQSSTR